MTTDVEGDVSTGSPDLNRKRAKRDRTKNKGLKSTESFGRNLSASPVGPEHSPCSSPNVVVKSVRIPTVEAGSSKRSSERRSDFNDFEEIVIISSDDDYESESSIIANLDGRVDAGSRLSELTSTSLSSSSSTTMTSMSSSEKPASGTDG